MANSVCQFKSLDVYSFNSNNPVSNMEFPGIHKMMRSVLTSLSTQLNVDTLVFSVIEECTGGGFISGYISQFVFALLTLFYVIYFFVTSFTILYLCR